MLIRQLFLVLGTILGLIVVADSKADLPLSLAGRWRFQMDPGDRGIAEQWPTRTLTNSAQLPGCLTEQGLGDPITLETHWMGGIADKSWFTAPEYEKYRQPGRIKIPFWLQPELYYAGAAWFQREVTIPKEWAGQRSVLFLERPHWETRVWVDGHLMGTNRSLGTPHEYELGSLPAGSHVLTVRVDNRMIVDIGENSHSISDHTQGNWNGIVGKIELRAHPEVWISDLQVYPDFKGHKVRVRVAGTNASGADFQGKLSLFFEQNARQTRLPVTLNLNNKLSQFESKEDVELPVETPPWDEFNPVLQTVRAELRGELKGQPFTSVRSTKFGLREISTAGTQFIINDRKSFFRGTLECAIFPRTGYPPTDLLSWKRIIGTARAHGLNLMRFHSWCPPEAAFVAADELGFYLHVEAGSWANQSTTLGDGKPVDDWVYKETECILREYGNHPSFVLMLYGNEPGGKNHEDYLSRWVSKFSALDPRRLYSSGAGWPQLAENQFHVTPDPRIQGWGAGLKSRINAQPPETLTDYRDYITQKTVPIISHEIGQWCVYPDFNEISQYTGYLKPRNFEIFRDRLEQNGLKELAPHLLHASGKLQTLCYKEEIESALRTPGFGGFELLDLHDFPGQGTALVGVLNAFWGEKGYVSPSEFRRFCNHTVPLARLARRVFTTSESLQAEIEVSHFGPTVLSNAVLAWKITEATDHVVAQGRLPAQTIAVGNGLRLGAIHTPLKSAHGPTQARLELKLLGTDAANDYAIWIYPNRDEPAHGDVRITAQFDSDAESTLRAGGKLLLSIPGELVRNFESTPVKLGFSSIFWNTAWTGRQPPTTLGIFCDPTHPALASFPTESWSDWQWWYLVHRAGALRLDLLPQMTNPIVRLIDDWVTARPLALIVEGRVGAGKIVICGFDLTHTPEDPVTRQMRTSLTRYLSSNRCNPTVEISPSIIRQLFVEADAKN